MFETAMSDMTLAPVKCCKVPLLTEVAKLALPNSDVQSYLLRLKEITANNKMYCCNALCSEFIG